MTSILDPWNIASPEDAAGVLLSCCAATRWARLLVDDRPFASEGELLAAADKAWAAMVEADWMEAFRAHPRIGERKAEQATAQSKHWSSQEQSRVDEADADIFKELAMGNRRYEDRFGFTYIVCATGKSAEEMLAILRRRLDGDRETELREAAEQQRQIMQLRMRKWLQIGDLP